MMHRNPQGWISHCAPPTDELKMTPITVRLPRPRPFSQLIGRCHALCYVIRHKAKNLVPVPKLPVTRSFDCKQKKGGGPGIATIHRALRLLFAPNPRYKSRHLFQRATTAQKVKAINRPTRVTSVIVISMLCAPNLSRAETSALCTEKC
jgi:hypothetical protein